MGLSFFCISQQGESHLKTGSPCQDSSIGRIVSLDKIQRQAVVCAVADGVGSCAFSHYGAKEAVESVLDYLEEKLPALDSIDDRRMLTLLQDGFAYALTQVEKTADERQLPFAEMDSTLTCAVLLDEGSLWFGHIGDDGLVVL